MGTLEYNSKLSATFDDRTLAHLQVVIWSKLRRGEHFAFTWVDEEASPPRTSVWCSPTIPMSFQFDQAEPSELNPHWVEVLTKAANSAGGLRLVPEPADAPTPAR
jgi:hypothetical protein